MEDFGFKLQTIKEKYDLKKILKFFLIFLAIFIFILILLIIAFSGDDENVTIENVALIKSEVKEIKKLPENEGGLVVNNLDVSIYDIIDNSEEINENPIINKTPQNIEVTQQEELDMSIGQDQLAQKINEISQDDGIILKTTSSEDYISDAKEQNLKTNITINNDIAKESTTNVEDLKQLGNIALVENLKNKKDIKPGIKVQLLALKSKDALIQYWEELENKYKNLFNDKNYYIENVNINGSIIYRLQVGTFQSEDKAKDFCKKYIETTNKSKIDCIVVGD